MLILYIVNFIILYSFDIFSILGFHLSTVNLEVIWVLHIMTWEDPQQDGTPVQQQTQDLLQNIVSHF